MCTSFYGVIAGNGYLRGDCNHATAGNKLEAVCRVHWGEVFRFLLGQQHSLMIAHESSKSLARKLVGDRSSF